MDEDTKKQDSKSRVISKDSQKSIFELSPVTKKAIELSFTAEKASSDGGLLLLKEIEDNIGIINSISNCIEDNRHQSYIEHSFESMISQRVYQIAAGYEDTNDCNDLKDDSIIKLCSGRLPQSDGSLASQSTMCRLENQTS